VGNKRVGRGLRGRVANILASLLQFGRQLVKMNFSKVCVLYGGAGVLRILGALSSLQDDL
jgi:hypothetical protein